MAYGIGKQTREERINQANYLIPFYILNKGSERNRLVIYNFFLEF
jgi:hypothetical protein